MGSPFVTEGQLDYSDQDFWKESKEIPPTILRNRSKENKKGVDMNADIYCVVVKESRHHREWKLSL